MRDYFDSGSPIRFLFPIDGDCINENDGTPLTDGVKITASVAAPVGHEIRICGQQAETADGCFRAEVSVCGSETRLTAEDLTAGTSCGITVYRLPGAMGGYRLSSDDNILFLQDITAHQEEYRSIFDNPYLAVYKKAHELYGAKVHLNLFYAFDRAAAASFSGERPDFDLSMMTGRFREEFIANSHWLKFSFHARSELPDCPYRYADGETVRRDCEAVHREIIRFAGRESLSVGTTTVHWGEATEEGVRALRQLGYRAMTGYFIPGEFPVAYYAPKDLIDYVYHRDFWKDRETDVVFGRIDLVLNCNTHEENMEQLREIAASPTRGGFVSLMIHEQYFYPDYVNYRPDFARRVLEACAYLAEKGYAGRHVSEAVGLV